MTHLGNFACSTRLEVPGVNYWDTPRLATGTLKSFSTPPGLQPGKEFGLTSVTQLGLRSGTGNRTGWSFFGLAPVRPRLQPRHPQDRSEDQRAARLYPGVRELGEDEEPEQRREHEPRKIEGQHDGHVCRGIGARHATLG